MFFSRSKPERSPRRIGSLSESRHAECMDWYGYLDPRLIETRELSTIDHGGLAPAAEAAPAGEERPAERSRRIAAELQRLELDLQRSTRRWIPRDAFSAKGPR
jgi:hypothetical protein